MSRSVNCRVHHISPVMSGSFPARDVFIGVAHPGRNPYPYVKRGRFVHNRARHSSGGSNLPSSQRSRFCLSMEGRQASIIQRKANNISILQNFGFVALRHGSVLLYLTGSRV